MKPTVLYQGAPIANWRTLRVVAFEDAGEIVVRTEELGRDLMDVERWTTPTADFHHRMALEAAVIGFALNPAPARPATDAPSVVHPNARMHRALRRVQALVAGLDLNGSADACMPDAREVLAKIAVECDDGLDRGSAAPIPPLTEADLAVAREHRDLLLGVQRGAGHNRETTPDVSPCLAAGLLAFDVDLELVELTGLGKRALAALEAGA